MKNIKFWVNNKTRMCSMTMGEQEAASNIASGFIEVTSAEQDAFRAETKQIQAAKTAGKGAGKSKGKKASSVLVVNASADELAKVMKDFNK